MDPLPSIIRINSNVNDLAKATEIVVDYQWKPKRHGNGRPAIQKSTRPISTVEQVDAEAKNEVPEARVLLADSAGESLEQVIPPTPPALNQDAVERLGLEGIHTKIWSVSDSHVELRDAPVIDAGNKILLPLDPIELTQDSLVAFVEDLQLVNSTQPSIEKDEASCVVDALRNVDHGSVSNSSKTESVPGVSLQDVYVWDQLEGSPGEAHPAEASLNYKIDDSTPGSIMRLTRKYCLVDVPNKVSTRDLQVEDLLNEDQAAIQKDLILAPMSDYMDVVDNASEDVPMQCPAYNPAQSQVESAVAEVGTDLLSLGVGYAYRLGQPAAFSFQLIGAGGWANVVEGLKFALLYAEVLNVAAFL
ncbi:hypothetical protein Nepgr_009271 [Nepenthes gracilis]|uniref:Uncharacterized protein n=1 Tax=Nepenthes gracilis TaxID=150966 RepID=A0AAD3SB15_NEPGR|nr:hypothetical protein Nepgr_009271 [Nepenthes gracilis]